MLLGSRASGTRGGGVGLPHPSAERGSAQRCPPVCAPPPPPKKIADDVCPLEVSGWGGGSNGHLVDKFAQHPTDGAEALRH